MKIKTAITRFVEKVLRQCREIQHLNRHAKRLNAEAMDVREYQAPHL